MRIAMANSFLPSSEKAGVATQVHGLANALVRRGHEVTVFTSSRPCDDSTYSVKTFAVPSALPRRLYSFAQALHLGTTDFRRFDIVHTHGDNYLMVKQSAQIRTFHGSASAERRAATRLTQKLYYATIEPLEALGACISPYNVAVSRATMDDIARLDEIIPCGISSSQFSPGNKSVQPTILFVGGLEGRKRGGLLVDAFRSIVRTRYPTAELWLVTRDIEEGDGVINFGQVPDELLADLYRRAWIFCMPSAYEGFGVPYVEAMASGTAVVTTPNPGAIEVLQDGVYGEICSPEALGQTINALLADTDRREAFVRQGLLRARDFDWDTIAERYELAYSNALSKRMNLFERLAGRARKQ